MDGGIQTWVPQIGETWWNISQMLHVWNIYLHLPQKWPSHVGKYSIHGASGYLKILTPAMLPSVDPVDPGLPPLQAMPAGSLEGVVVVVPPFSEGQDANLMRLGWAASITKEMVHDT